MAEQGKVDVLAVMARAAGNCGGAGIVGSEEDLLAARAAVADLIATAESAAAVLHNAINARHIAEAYRPYQTELDAALVKVRP